MNKAKHLYELQEIDLEMQRKTESLAQVNSQLGRDDELVAARAVLETAKKHLVELAHQQKAADWELSDLEAKIAVVDKKLYGGSVKNPRELEGLQQDAELLKTHRGEREDKLLALMMDTEAAQADVAQKSSEFVAVEKTWQENQQKLSQQKTEVESESVNLGQERESLGGQIDSATLRLYEELRRARQGLAVAKVMQGRCQGCRISLSMSDMQKARSAQELATCSNCGRILYLS